jgi:SAM-dependent methyltransferase
VISEDTLAPYYDRIGVTYSATRHEDPRVRALLHAALGDARSVVNVGAGTGSYEPPDRHVIAIEPSDTMSAQRSGVHVPALRGTADRLPLRDRSVDAAMAVLTIHHWDGGQYHGVRELCRVARERVVIVTFDPTVSSEMWLIRDYMPEVAELDQRIFPSIQTLRSWLDGVVTVTAVPTGRDTPDWTLASFWAHPERVLDAQARNGTSGFASLSPQATARVTREVTRDLQNGRWDERHGELRSLAEYDAGMRLVVADLSAGPRLHA